MKSTGLTCSLRLILLDLSEVGASGISGVAVKCVDLGGRRIIKKKMLGFY